MNIYIPGKGVTAKPKMVFVGEAPSHEEEIALEPFVGPSGRFLNGLMADAGIDRSQCWMTNVSKYMVIPQPKEGKKIPFAVRAQMAGVNLEQQVSELRKELITLGANVIVGLGNTALKYCTGKDGIQNYRGSILLSNTGHKFVGSYHPAHVLHQTGESTGYWQKYVIAADLKRAKKQSEFPEIVLPSRNLRVIQNSAQLYEFLSRHRKNLKRKAALDIEAHNCIPICLGIAFDPHEGVTVPLWNLLPDGTVISLMSDKELANCWMILADFLADDFFQFIGQNFGYDRDKLKRLGFILHGLYSDTMLKSFAINPEFPKNLAFNTSTYTEEPFYKNEGMYEGSINDLLIGCARDACCTWEVDSKQDTDIDTLGLRDYYNNFLLPLHDLYLEIESEGFRVSEPIRQELLHKYIEWDEQLRYQLFKIAGKPVNVYAYEKLGQLIYDEWNIPERKGTGEEVLTTILNSKNGCKNELHRKGLELILEDRRVRKTIEQYLYSVPDYDGRMRTSYFICLETGRSSTQQQEAPIRPTVEYRDEENKKKSKAMGMAFQTITKHGDIGPDIRKQFIPDEGEIFLQVDSSQAEARVIFLLAEDYQALEDIDKHDYHALTASWFFGGTENDYSKKVLGYESPYRFAGKTLRHAGHLGASKRRAALSVNTDARKFKIDYQISEYQADVALKIFHAKQPNIKNVFQAGVINALSKDRRLEAPIPYGIKASHGGIRVFHERWNDELFRQAFSYLPQRTISENTKAAALRIKKNHSWIRIIVESHDALLVSVPIGRKQEAAIILKREFEVPIDFSNCTLRRGKLVIPAEVEEGYNYYDLSKFRFIQEAA